MTHKKQNHKYVALTAHVTYQGTIPLTHDVALVNKNIFHCGSTLGCEETESFTVAEPFDGADHSVSYHL